LPSSLDHDGTPIRRLMDPKPAGAAVLLSEVSKSYGAVRALDTVTLSISAGEFVTLLGPSGSGKTTMLNIVAGFVVPDSGNVEIGGRSVVGLPPYRRGLGMVFQHYALFPHMTVFENIAFPLRMRRMNASHTARSVRHVLELVRLSDLGSRYPHQLSGGQQQRIAMARAIVFDPQVLLMDEPLGALDRNLREQLQFELRRLHRQLGVTILYVTHDQQEALVMSDRVALMNMGRIVQVDTGRGLYERPNGEFVAQFLGESNLLTGKVVGRGDNVVHVTINDLTTRIVSSRSFTCGESIRILIRPERVRLAGPGETGFTAKVEDITYLGDYWRAVIQLRPGPLLTAKFSNVGVIPIADGTEIRVTWDPQDLLVLSSHDSITRPEIESGRVKSGSSHLG
jgi:putative spermidine/putrescine transport system ATP-binding protein